MTAKSECGGGLVVHRWVRCVAFDSSNEWFVTGSADRTIKVWDLASGQLKLTLTGHIEQVRSSPSTIQVPINTITCTVGNTSCAS